MDGWKFFQRLLCMLVVFWLLTKLVGLLVGLLLFVIAVILAAGATIWHFRKKIRS
jgi:hypothetical protein